MDATAETETPTIPEWKPCSQCGTVYRLWDEHGNPLPRPQRPSGRPRKLPPELAGRPTLPFAIIRASRYKAGVRLRDICDTCHSANEARRKREQRAERARAQRQQEHAARETGEES